ncbi:MAG TPA: aspartyl protease family protein, partial [Chitinophagales bacterium]|nr:aspartyl protease family protein [Chitinophagales bacterium]
MLVRLCLWFLAVVCGLQMSHAQVLPQSGFTFANPKKKWVRLPIEIHHNLILIPIKINNKLEVNFILDSGSRTTIFTEPLLLTLANVKPARRTIKLQGLGKGETITAQLVEGLRL